MVVYSDMIDVVLRFISPSAHLSDKGASFFIPPSIKNILPIRVRYLHYLICGQLSRYHEYLVTSDLKSLRFHDKIFKQKIANKTFYIRKSTSIHLFIYKIGN